MSYEDESEMGYDPYEATGYDDFEPDIDEAQEWADLPWGYDGDDPGYDSFEAYGEYDE